MSHEAKTLGCYPSKGRKSLVGSIPTCSARKKECYMNTKNYGMFEWMIALSIILAIVLVVVLAQTWLFMTGWNLVVVPLFQMPTMTFTMAVWAVVLLNVVAGLFRSSVSVSKK